MKGSRLPCDWQPTPELIAWAKVKRPDLDVSEQIEWFRDFWESKPGANACKLNWDATWRNWIRAARGTQASYQNAPTQRHKTLEVTRRETTSIRREPVVGMPQQAADLFARLGIK